MVDIRIDSVKIWFIIQGEYRFNPILSKSTKWLNWIAIIDLRTCKICRFSNGQIRKSIADWSTRPPVHRRCHCSIKPMTSINAGTATIQDINGADYWLKNRHKLPYYYLKKGQAKKLGWKSRTGNLHKIIPGKQIGGDIFMNNKGKLPSSPGRTWYEADINYTRGFRNTHRILFSNDGLIFVTYDHYETFFEII